MFTADAFVPLDSDKFALMLATPLPNKLEKFSQAANAMSEAHDSCRATLLSAIWTTKERWHQLFERHRFDLLWLHAACVIWVPSEKRSKLPLQLFACHVAFLFVMQSA
jgi:hypothetical protein